MADGTTPSLRKSSGASAPKEYHRNYFIFGRDARRLSRADVNEIVTAADPSPALSATLKRLADDQVARRSPRVPSLLEQITEAVSAKPLLTPSLLRAILDHSDDLIRREDVVWELFVTHNNERLRTLIKFGLEKLDLAQREEILDVLVSHKTGLQTRADVVEGYARHHGLYGGEKKHETERLFPADKIEAAALAIRDQIVSACEDRTVWNAPMPIRLICAWKRMDDGDAPADWLTRVLADDELVVRLANELPGRSYQTGGRHGARVVWTFSRSNWQGLFNVETLFNRLETLASSNADAASALSRLREAEEAAKD